jgi:hypothetical protein
MSQPSPKSDETPSLDKTVYGGIFEKDGINSEQKEYAKIFPVNKESSTQFELTNTIRIILPDNSKITLS